MFWHKTIVTARLKVSSFTAGLDHRVFFADFDCSNRQPPTLSASISADTATPLNSGENTIGEVSVDANRARNQLVNGANLCRRPFHGRQGRAEGGDGNAGSQLPVSRCGVTPVPASALPFDDGVFGSLQRLRTDETHGANGRKPRHRVSDMAGN